MLTQERLKELLHYDPETGEFIRLVKTAHTVQVGDLVGWVTARGYRHITIDGKTYYGHRLVWLYVYGVFPKDQLDHINHDKLDNRLSNLRMATNTENHRNRGLSESNTSGVVGVNWDKSRKKWRAEIMVGGKGITLGRFADKEDAIAAREAANIKYGFHENHGKGE